MFAIWISPTLQLYLQWNPSIKATIGDEILTSLDILTPIERFPCRFVLKMLCGLSRESVLTSGVVVKRDSTVIANESLGCYFGLPASYSTV